MTRSPEDTSKSGTDRSAIGIVSPQARDMIPAPAAEAKHNGQTGDRVPGTDTRATKPLESITSTLLSAELAESLDINDDGFGGQLFTYTASQAVSSVLDYALDNVAHGIDVANAGFGGGLFYGLDGVAQGGPFVIPNPAVFIGSYLGHQIVQAENLGVAIGGAIGSTLGAIIGGSTAVAAHRCLTLSPRCRAVAAGRVRHRGAMGAIVVADQRRISGMLKLDAANDNHSTPQRLAA